ncbi:MAG: DMT family transporter [Sandaracinaceae bacterium]
MKPAREPRVFGALLLAVVSISFAAVFFRLASASHPLVVSATRLTLASCVLAIPTFRAYRAGRLPSRVRRRAALCGLLYAAHFGTWVTSLSMTSVASSVTLVTATPILLVVASLISGRDRPERRQLISIGLALVGLTLIGHADLGLSEEALVGDGLAFLGAAAMAGYLLIARRLGEELDVLAFSGVATLVGAATLFAVALGCGVPITFASHESLLWTAMAALVPQLIGHTLLTWSLRHATPTAVGIATVGEPVGATLLAWWLLGDRGGAMSALGCAVTLFAVLLSVRRPS